MDASAKVFRAERTARGESVCHAEDRLGIVGLLVDDDQVYPGPAKPVSCQELILAQLIKLRDRLT